MKRSKIQSMQDGVKILAAIIAYDSDERLWTTKIFADLLRVSFQRADAAVNALRISGYLARYRVSFIITHDGCEYYADACRQPDIRASISAWRDEALSGITPSGRRSKIDSAALPTCSPPRAGSESYQSIEELLARAKERTELMTKLCLDTREFDARIKDGSIQMCRGHDGDSHVGIFDAKNSGWQYLCRKCRKNLRGKRNGKQQNRVDR